MTWTDVDAAGAAPLVIVPLGSLEQHGPHLPLDTDSVIAEALAGRLSERLDNAVVAPTVAIAASGEHAGFPGTLSIGTDVTSAVVVELVRSADWADGVVLVNGHGGNRGAVDRAVATLHHEGRRVLSWWPAVDDGDAHAGATETSLMLAIDAARVQTERIEAGNTTAIAELAGLLRRDGVRAASPNGVLGDPTTANAEAGDALLATLTDSLVTAVVDWRGAA